MPHRKILVIDDDADMLSMTKVFLESREYDAVTADNGVDGLRLAKEQQPDVILLDLILAKMDGLEVCLKLKEDDATRHIPVIMISGSDLETVVMSEPKLKIEHYLKKPFDPNDLIQIIEKIERGPHVS